jgi:hypothetical protein
VPCSAKWYFMPPSSCRRIVVRSCLSESDKDQLLCT